MRSHVTKDISRLTIPELKRAVEQEPDNPVLHAQLGLRYQQQKDWKQAEHHYLQAQALVPDYAPVFNNLALLYKEMGRFDEGLVYIKKAVEYNPDHPEFLNNQGTLLLLMNAYEEAERVFRHVIRLAPQSSEGYCNLATVYLAQDDVEGAWKAISRACSLRPDGVSENWNRAMILLKMGRYAEGFPAYEWRWKKESFQKITRSYPQPRWDGQPHPDSTLLLWSEQGYGDTVQMIRYCEQLKALFRRIVLLAPEPLHRLLETHPAVDEVVTDERNLPLFDFHLPVMSIPRFFTTNLATIPRKVPYLFPRCDQGQTLATEGSSYRIGLVWSGNPRHQNDHNRSCELRHFAPLAQLPGVELYSFQKGPARKALRSAPFPVIDLHDRIQDFHDTACYLRQMDLVITVDTALVHVAGALGCPTWLLLSTRSDWRWLTVREDSPWYPTVKLFRQSIPGDWASVFSRVCRCLSEELETA
ncbi:MAG: hypothetical protein D6762_00275 [Candidatus Neomarinimicrobiota bacterium]|nr:MAG: hypothetical protein D6762_00275 [Candidatus Neomarinimicrobiota bacterium]